MLSTEDSRTRSMALSALHHSGLKRTYRAPEFAVIAKEEQSDTSHPVRRLLRVRHQRLPRRPTANLRDELASPHTHPSTSLDEPSHIAECAAARPRRTYTGEVRRRIRYALVIRKSSAYPLCAGVKRNSISAIQKGGNKMTILTVSSLVSFALTAVLSSAAMAQDAASQRNPAFDFATIEAAQNAANSNPGPRTVPGRSIPVPKTASPELQASIAGPYRVPA
jgi:hypothetical protein